MEAGIIITADETVPEPNDTLGGNPVAYAGAVQAGVMGLDSVHVSGPGEAETNGDEISGAKWECSLCHAKLREDGTDVEHGESECPESMEDNPIHEPEPIPLSWLNSAAIDVSDDNDTVTVTISVGDPRGAFAMKVERMRYTDPETGQQRDELRLHVPTDQDAMPHMQLEPLASPGYYRIRG